MIVLKDNQVDKQNQNYLYNQMKFPNKNKELQKDNNKVIIIDKKI